MNTSVLCGLQLLCEREEAYCFRQTIYIMITWRILQTIASKKQQHCYIKRCASWPHFFQNWLVSTNISWKLPARPQTSHSFHVKLNGIPVFLEILRTLPTAMQAEYYAHRQQKNICNLFAQKSQKPTNIYNFMLKTHNYRKLLWVNLLESCKQTNNEVV